MGPCKAPKGTNTKVASAKRSLLCLPDSHPDPLLERRTGRALGFTTRSALASPKLSISKLEHVFSPPRVEVDLHAREPHVNKSVAAMANWDTAPLLHLAKP